MVWEHRKVEQTKAKAWAFKWTRLHFYKLQQKAEGGSVFALPAAEPIDEIGSNFFEYIQFV